MTICISQLELELKHKHSAKSKRRVYCNACCLFLSTARGLVLLDTLYLDMVWLKQYVFCYNSI